MSVCRRVGQSLTLTLALTLTGLSVSDSSVAASPTEPRTPNRTSNAAPAAGRYDARLCVATAASAPLTCGPAMADWRPPSRLRAQVGDIVYRLQLRSSQLDMALMHGAMQIDELSADFSWEGQTLRFADTDKDTRYEVQLLRRVQAAGAANR